jgi:hypothetical protein
MGSTRGEWKGLVEQEGGAPRNSGHGSGSDGVATNGIWKIGFDVGVHCLRGEDEGLVQESEMEKVVQEGDPGQKKDRREIEEAPQRENR